MIREEYTFSLWLSAIKSFDDKVYGGGDKSWMNVGECGAGLSLNYFLFVVVVVIVNIFVAEAKGFNLVLICLHEKRVLCVGSHHLPPHGAFSSKTDRKLFKT